MLGAQILTPCECNVSCVLQGQNSRNRNSVRPHTRALGRCGKAPGKELGYKQFLILLFRVCKICVVLPHAETHLSCVPMDVSGQFSKQGAKLRGLAGGRLHKKRLIGCLWGHTQDRRESAGAAEKIQSQPSLKTFSEDTCFIYFPLILSWPKLVLHSYYIHHCLRPLRMCWLPYRLTYKVQNDKNGKAL